MKYTFQRYFKKADTLVGSGAVKDKSNLASGDGLLAVCQDK